VKRLWDGGRGVEIVKKDEEFKLMWSDLGFTWVHLGFTSEVTWDLH
jgi:hypothetical protein